MTSRAPRESATDSSPQAPRGPGSVDAFVDLNPRIASVFKLSRSSLLDDHDDEDGDGGSVSSERDVIDSTHTHFDGNRDDSVDTPHAGSSSDVILSHNGPDGTEILSDVLLKMQQSGVRCSPFYSDLVHIRRSLESHGLLLSLSDGVVDDLVHCRSKLLYHLFTGGCVSNGVERGRKSACNHFTLLILLRTSWLNAHSQFCWILTVTVSFQVNI